MIYMPFSWKKAALKIWASSGSAPTVPPFESPTDCHYSIEGWPAWVALMNTAMVDQRSVVKIPRTGNKWCRELQRKTCFICSAETSKEPIAQVEPPSSKSYVSEDVQCASDILQFRSESTPPPKSDDAASEVNGSSKQTKKNKRAQWFSVCIIAPRLFSVYMRSLSTVLENIDHFFTWPLGHGGQNCAGNKFKVLLGYVVSAVF